MQSIRTLSFICLIITCYYFIYFIYAGLSNPIPGLGDSWDYHIPTAKLMLNGGIIDPGNLTEYKLYFPGASEIFLALFIFSHLPLTLSNIFAIFILGIVSYHLAKTFSLNKYYALIFATTIVTLNAVARWMNAISVDVWIAIFFCLLVILLEKPKKQISYFLQLGTYSGMLFGSKYTTVVFLFVLFLFYIKKLLPVVTTKNVISFIIPFSLFGLFWYIRNYLLTGNPIYPIPVFGFPGVDIFGSGTMISIGLLYPLDMFNAAFGELKLWLFTVVLGIGVLIHQFFFLKKYTMPPLTKIFLMAIVSFIFFLNFSTNAQIWIMVTSFRYSYPVFILFILGTFLFASKYKKEHIIGYTAIACMITFATPYLPKLIFFYFPLAVTFFYFFEKEKKLPRR